MAAPGLTFKEPLPSEELCMPSHKEFLSRVIKNYASLFLKISNKMLLLPRWGISSSKLLECFCEGVGKSAEYIYVGIFT